MIALLKFFGIGRQNPRTLQFGKLTWVGLMIVALGWTFLLSGLSLADIVTRLSGHASPAVMSISAAVVSQCTILTGFGIALLGLLQTGFGALQRFFDSVLERTARRQDTDPGFAPPANRPGPASKPRPKIVERGLLKDRAYVLFGDGSIEVQTMLGLRRFQSFKEAAKFIG